MQTIIRNIKNEPVWSLLKKAREEIFVHEQGLDNCVIADEYDDTCTHIIYTDRKEVMASCRVRLECDVAYIERISVNKQFRQQSLSRKMINEALFFIDTTDSRWVIIIAQSHLVAMYEKYGFESIGSEYPIYGRSHIKMIKAINTRRTL